MGSPNGLLDPARLPSWLGRLLGNTMSVAERKAARTAIGATVETIYDVNLAGLSQVVWPGLANFDQLEFSIEGISATGGLVFLALSEDNGSSFITGAGTYFSGLASKGDNNGWTYGGGNSDQVDLTGGGSAMYGFNLKGCFANLQVNGQRSFVKVEGIEQNSVNQAISLVWNIRTASTAIHNAMRLQLSTGTFASGRATLKGIRK